MDEHLNELPKVLILIPTQFELNFVKNDAAKWIADSGLEIQLELCGFGPVASAARTMQLIQRLKPSFVLLMGIAGGYAGSETIEHAFQFHNVGCHGVGIGDGTDFHTASSEGWNQWPGNAETPLIKDVIALNVDADQDKDKIKPLLVTVCGASQNAADCDARLKVYPHAFAEDMEGYGAATACQLEHTPLTIVRGISNQVGDRDVGSWKIESAMRAAFELSKKVLTSVANQVSSVSESDG